MTQKYDGSESYIFFLQVLCKDIEGKTKKKQGRKREKRFDLARVSPRLSRLVNCLPVSPSSKDFLRQVLGKADDDYLPSVFLEGEIHLNPMIASK